MASNTDKRTSIAIVGGGIAGLQAAQSLLTNSQCNITLYESSDRCGGRIRVGQCAGQTVQLGAELVHGYQTPLTEAMEQYWPMMTREARDDSYLEEIFIISHADGGPSDRPTSKGKVGVYYVHGKLYAFDDPRMKPLRDALDELENKVQEDPSSSLLSIEEYLLDLWTKGDYDTEHIQELLALAVASFGNTVGCTDLSKISAQAWVHFEEWWEANEQEGDYCFVHGMHSIVERIVQELEGSDRLTIQCNCAVTQITDATDNDDHGRVRVEWQRREDGIATTTEVALFDAVIVTIPPKQWPGIIPHLPLDKHQALDRVGMELAIKVVVAFRSRMWPDNISCLVSGDHAIPEMWFRPVSETLYLAVGFLTSGAARSFRDTMLEVVESKANHVDLNRYASDERVKERATELVARELADTFGYTPENVLAGAIVSETVVHAWNEGGYMFPQVGLQLEDLRTLAAPLNRVHFAGEATHFGACMTVQAAMATGARAAGEVTESLFSQCAL